MGGETQGVSGIAGNVGPASSVRDITASRRQPEPASNNSRSYWDYYVDADIPWYERVLAGAALPIVAPLLLVGSLTGCGGEGESYPRTDAGRNTGPDTGRDAGQDVGRDAGVQDSGDAGHPVNHPPSLSPIANQTVQEGQNLSFIVSASDPDGQAVTISTGPLPSGAAFNPATGLFEWNQIAALPGNYPIVFIASDGQLTANETVSIHVLQTSATQISTGPQNACAIMENGALTCWGNNNFGQSTPPVGTFTQVSVGSDFACAVLNTGAIECWGHDTFGDTTPPVGSFTQLDASSGDFGSFTCGVLNAGAVRCWGSAHTIDTLHPPVANFTQVSADGDFVCGVLNTGAIQCWGANGFYPSPPAGNFTQISSGEGFVCGVRNTGDIGCSGRNEFGQSTPPVGNFTRVSAGVDFACGIITTGAIECWGNDTFGDTNPPAGNFTRISAGNFYACGILSTGAIRCWGDNNYGKSTPPSYLSY